MFILISFSPASTRVENDVRATLIGHGSERFNLPGSAIVVRVDGQDEAEQARKALVALRARYVERGRAFEFVWLRLNPTEISYYPRDPKDRPSWNLQQLAKVLARDV